MTLRRTFYCRRGKHRDQWSSQVAAVQVDWELDHSVALTRNSAHCRDCTRVIGPIDVRSWRPMEQLLPKNLRCPQCRLVHDKRAGCP